MYLAYCVEDVMTNPVFGYDTALPQQLGLNLRGVRGILRAAWLLLLRVSRTVAPSLLRRAH